MSPNAHNKKTPREHLRESLQKNAEHIATKWTPEMRSAICTARIFAVAPVIEGDDTATGGP